MLTGDVSYVPGMRTAVAGDQCWALVEASADSPAVGRFWQRLSQGAAADELLDQDRVRRPEQRRPHRII